MPYFVVVDVDDEEDDDMEDLSCCIDIARSKPVRSGG
jgi:hypothetical protein